MGGATEVEERSWYLEAKHRARARQLQSRHDRLFILHRPHTHPPLIVNGTTVRRLGRRVRNTRELPTADLALRVSSPSSPGRDAGLPSCVRNLLAAALSCARMWSGRRTRYWCAPTYPTASCPSPAPRPCGCPSACRTPRPEACTTVDWISVDMRVFRIGRRTTIARPNDAQRKGGAEHKPRLAGLYPRCYGGRDQG